MRLEKRIAKQRQRRQFRVRNRVRTTGRPRLTVFRSNKHMYAQIIDDQSGRSLIQISSLSPEIRTTEGAKTAVSAALGKLIAERAVEKGIKKVVFDRGGYLYHGRVKAVAEAAREAGLEF